MLVLVVVIRDANIFPQRIFRFWGFNFTPNFRNCGSVWEERGGKSGSLFGPALDRRVTLNWMVQCDLLTEEEIITISVIDNWFGEVLSLTDVVFGGREMLGLCCLENGSVFKKYFCC